MFSKKKKDKKEETFNALDEGFQWNPTLDPDHIFEAELELVKQVKKELPELETEHDKFLVVFLIARRHDVADTVALFKKFLKLQKEFGFTPSTPPSFSHNPHLSAIKAHQEFPFIHPKGYRDKHDRMLRYFHMSKDNPSKRDPKTTYTTMFWQTYFLIQTEPLCAWRNGIAVVVDLKDFSWKNIDMSSKGREVNNAVQGTFPMRLRAFHVVNGGSIIGALVQAAKLVVPKKIMSRMALMDSTQLKENIPNEFLLVEYDGGTCDLSFENYLRQVKEQEEVLYQKGIWKLAPPKSPNEEGKK